MFVSSSHRQYLCFVQGGLYPSSPKKSCRGSLELTPQMRFEGSRSVSVARAVRVTAHSAALWRDCELPKLVGDVEIVRNRSQMGTLASRHINQWTEMESLAPQCNNKWKMR